MTQSSNAIENEFVIPNAENLLNLGPGCFVRVAHEAENVWVEITEGKDQQLVGIAHPELSDGDSAVAADTQMQVKVEKINALGCNRYCYCD
jgi:hypothetical protein